MGSLCCGFDQPAIIRPYQRLDQTTILTEITRDYKIGKLLGAGHFGTVRLAKSVWDPSKIFAVKIISKQKVTERLHILRREIEILRQLDHPNLVNLFEVYEDSKYIHLVMEYCSGGELIQKLLDEGHYSEHDAALIFKQILQAVNHLHQVGISHRDLKPENFLFENQSPNALVKLVDFGLSTRFGAKFESRRMYTMVGTPYYVAPEVLQGSYSYKCDLWSCGIILFILLSGNLPFSGQTNQEIFHNVINQELEFHGDSWEEVGFEVRDLIFKLLQKRSEDRIDAITALNHPWFKTATPETKINIKSDILQRLVNYNSTSVFKKQVLGYLVKVLSTDQIKELREAFLWYDQNQTGYLSIMDLKKILNESGMQISTEKLNKIIKNVDFHNNGRIDYSEFLAATLSCKEQLNKEEIWNAFKHFDIDGSGTISRQDLLDSYNRAGQFISKSEINNILRQVDKRQIGEITFEEFEEMLLEQLITLKMFWGKTLASLDTATVHNWSYGTAGFRGPGDQLPGIAFRCGLFILYKATLNNQPTGLMITASHNPYADNGIKFVDSNGEVIPPQFEAISEEFLGDDLEAILQKYLQEQPNQKVILGRDNRPSSFELANQVRLAVESSGGTLDDFGEVTTPMLHWMVKDYNTNGSTSIQSYVDHFSRIFKELFESIEQGDKYETSLQLDCSGGVSARFFPRLLPDSLQIEVKNAEGVLLNEGCGAEFVNKSQRLPLNFDENYAKCLSFDGDADRLLYFYYKDGLVSFSGEHLCALWIQAFRHLGVTQQVYVVTSALSNGGFFRWMEENNIPFCITPTGVKHMHHKAAEQPIGIYFEPNGHATVLVQPQIIEEYRENKQIFNFLSLSNQQVGDAMADALLCEASLKLLNWNLCDWISMFEMFKLFTSSVPAVNPRVVQCNWEDTEVVQPEGLGRELEELKQRFEGCKLIVRPSGTEPIVRVQVEAEEILKAREIGELAVEIVSRYV